MKIISPLAQSFSVDPDKYPNGFFVHSVHLFFKTKDTAEPITIDFRPLVNGIPDNKVVYADSKVTVYPNKINLRSGISGDVPTGHDELSYTEFRLTAPICLLPGDHCFVISTNSKKYELWTNRIGEKSSLTNNNLIVSTDSGTGCIFKSNNSTTYVAELGENLTYKINVCKFDTTKVGTVKFESAALNSANPTLYTYHLFNVAKNDAQPTDTYINHFYACNIRKNCSGRR